MRAHIGKLVSVAASGILLVFGSTALAAPAQIQFKDMNSATWAKAYVTLLAYQGVVHGTGGGRFTPNGDVTRAQALTMIARAVTSLPGDKHISLKFKDSRLIPSFAVGAVEDAIHLGILENSGDLYPAKPAKRADVIVWLVRALGLSAAGAPTSDLTAFTDASTAPKFALPYLARGVALGLIEGERGKLDPQGTITRAQFAAVLARLEENYGFPLLKGNQGVRSGVLSAVKTDKLVVTLDDGAEAGIAVPTGTPVYLNNASSSLSALTPGDRVIVGSGAAAAAQLVVAESAAGTPNAVRGIVTSLSGSALSVAVLGAGEKTFTLPAGMPILGHARPRPASELKVGSSVQLMLGSSGSPTALTLLGHAASFSGTITSVRPKGVFVQDAKGARRFVAVDASTQVIAASGTTALAAGQKVRVLESGVRGQGAAAILVQ